MKKYTILALSFCSLLHGMEKQITLREPREWDAHAYEKGNSLQTAAFLHFIQTNNIKTENRTILDAGCGTGKISAYLAKNADSVHGFDASKNMVEFAQNKYGSIHNLSFEHCFAEDFQSEKSYQLSIMSSTFHWIADKKMALQHIIDHLESNGEFFANILTSNNPTPLNLIAGRETIEIIKLESDVFNNQKLLHITGSSYPSTEELATMLTESGFEISIMEEQSLDYPMSKDEIIELQWPIIASRPGIQGNSTKFIQKFFDIFINLYLEKLTKIDDDKFLDTFFTTIVHARKK